MMQQLMVLVLCFWVYESVLAGDCKLAQAFFDKGLEYGKQSQWEAAQQWLRKSAQMCNRFNNWYLLGQAEQALKHLPEALAAYEDARHYTENSDEQALTMARYAQVLALQGQIGPPLTLLHEARQLHANAPQWMTDLAMDLDQQRTNNPLLVSEVTRALTNRKIKLFKKNAKPQYNVSIRFKKNSTTLQMQSSESIEVLADALMDTTLQDKQFTIWGHADKTGENQYNKALSLKRAKFIVAELIKQQPSLAQRLMPNGMGEDKPLYEGDSEAILQLNRRIEVQVD